jgi:hypothetical protein
MVQLTRSKTHRAAPDLPTAVIAVRQQTLRRSRKWTSKTVHRSINVAKVLSCDPALVACRNISKWLSPKRNPGQKRRLPAGPKSREHAKCDPRDFGMGDKSYESSENVICRRFKS